MSNQEQTNAQTNTKEIREDEKNIDWIRLLLNIFFWIVFQISQFIVGIIALIQAGFVIICREPNKQLIKFSDGLRKYIDQIIEFLHFTSDVRPFPFSELPKSDIIIDSQSN